MTTPFDDLGLLDNRYEILGRIGQGGMGAVYLARHLLLDELRVIKVRRPQHEAVEENRLRFEREARTAIKLKHPDIAQIHDFMVEPGGGAWIVMEYVNGVALDRVLAHCGKLPLGAAVQVAQRALGALDYLHQRGFVHRDIAPDNIMLTRSLEGDPGIKIIDLGLAGELADNSRITDAGVFLGTLRYCAPEQFGHNRLDQRSDLYSLGVILYEMLTGCSPIPGDTIREVIVSQMMTSPIDFATTDPEERVPDALRSVILRALEKSPERRHENAIEMSEALRPFEQSSDLVTNQLNELLIEAREARPQVVALEHGDSDDDHQELEAALSTSSAFTAQDLDETLTRRIPVPGKELSALGASSPARPRIWPRALWVAPLAAALLLVLWLGREPRTESEAPVETASGSAQSTPAALAVHRQLSAATLGASGGAEEDGEAADSTDALTSFELASITAPAPVSLETRPKPAARNKVDRRSPERPARGLEVLPGARAGVASGDVEPLPATPEPSQPTVQLEVMELQRRAEALRAGGFDRMPSYIEDSFEPPPVLQRTGEVRSFEFDVQLDRDGAVLNIRPLGVSPDRAYADSLEASLLRTRFFPGLRNGEPARGRFKARIVVAPELSRR